MKGPWPYAPVLEALSDLSRQHPALLDGLEEVYRLEIERALSARDVTWCGESGHQSLFVAAAELVRLAAAGHGLLMVVDDLHHADEASCGCCTTCPAACSPSRWSMVLAHRPLASDQSAKWRRASSLEAAEAGSSWGRSTSRQPDACSPMPFRTWMGTPWSTSAGPAVACHSPRSSSPPATVGARTATCFRSCRDRAADLGAGCSLGPDVHHRRAARRLRGRRGEGYRHLEAGLASLVIEGGGQRTASGMRYCVTP